MNTALSLATQPGVPVRLGAEIASAGEGVIYELPGRPTWVAKLYHAPPLPAKAAKLRAMADLPADRIPPSVAWPLHIIEADGMTRGFIMPRISGRHDLHLLWSGISRRALFPSATYATLVAVAANLARAVAGVHQAGHVIGDVNERCAMVGQDATVTLIDCDSFQFDSDGRRYGCDVGIPMYQPPELQGSTSFRNLSRLRNHDAFGLAVLVFQLLFFARHPFAGRPVSGEAPEIPDAIRDYRFAWAGDKGILQPPKTLSLADVGPTVEIYFRRAFGSEGVSGGRPKAAAWAKTLDELRASLKVCGANSAHQHLGQECPLCRVEAEIGGDLFALSGPSRPASNPERDVQVLWAAIDAVAPPKMRPAAPSPTTYTAAVWANPYPPRPKRVWLGAALQSIGLLSPLADKELKARQAKLHNAERAYDCLLASWRTHDVQAAFSHEKRTLADTKASAEEIFRRRSRLILELTHRTELQRHLERFTIASSGIPGIGPKRLATLHAYAMITAADLSKRDLTALPGFGPQRVGSLLAWRDTCAKKFKAATGRVAVDPAAASRIDGDLAPEINGCLTRLRDGAAALRRIVTEEHAKTLDALQQIETAAVQVAQAKADLQAPRE